MTGPIAPDALRESVRAVLLSNLRATTGGCTCDEAYTGRNLVDPHCGWHEALGTTDDESVDAVLAVVAKHRDAEVERLTKRVHKQNRRLIGQRDAAQDRIARALAVVLTQPTAAYQILRGDQ